MNELNEQEILELRFKKINDLIHLLIDQVKKLTLDCVIIRDEVKELQKKLK